MAGIAELLDADGIGLTLQQEGDSTIPPVSPSEAVPSPFPDPRRARNLHRRLVPVLAAPLLLTLLSGIGLSRAPSDTLYALHTGAFGALDLTGVYTAVLGICTLLLLIT